MDDVIEIGFDGKHSFEDKIMPVEQVFQRWGDRIALLGGVDMDLLVRGSQDDVRRRPREILQIGSAFILGVFVAYFSMGLGLHALVEKLELYLESMGFKGCRVQLDRYKKDIVYIQVLEKDIAELAIAANRSDLVHFFNDSGVKRIFMDLNGR